MKRRERLCNSCGKVFKYLPSVTKGHVPRSECYVCKPKDKSLRPAPPPKEKNFGCITIAETEKRLAARGVALHL